MRLCPPSFKGLGVLRAVRPPFPDAPLTVHRNTCTVSFLVLLHQRTDDFRTT